MNKLMIALLTLNSASVLAAESFVCTNPNNSKQGFELKFEKPKSVVVTNNDGGDYFLDLAKSTTKNTVYGNYEYDGYGGSIELLLPKKFTLTRTTKAFKATLIQETYSELGHVGSEKIVANCKKI